VTLADVIEAAMPSPITVTLAVLMDQQRLVCITCRRARLSSTTGAIGDATTAPFELAEHRRRSQRRDALEANCRSGIYALRTRFCVRNRACDCLHSICGSAGATAIVLHAEARTR
jgi:hypothetical protein